MLGRGIVVLGLLLGFLCASSVRSTPALRLSSPAPDASGLFRVPLHFEPNRGQAPPGVRFLARGHGYAFLLSGNGAELRLAGSAAGETLRMRFAGAKPLLLFPERALPGRIHYFSGSDPERWLRNVPTYSRVRAPQLYPGVDLVCYGNQRRVEYDFELAPGADPGLPALELSGPRAARLSPEGDLLLTFERGQVRQKRPLAYQAVGGRRLPVPVEYRLSPPAQEEKRREPGSFRVAFHLGPYDRSRRLVIDPTLEFSSFLGGAGVDEGTAIGVDAEKNLYLAGFTASANFPKESPVQGTLGGGQDAFVTKLDASGTFLHYSTFLGGAAADRAFGIGVRPGGGCAVAGFTQSSNFPTLDPEQEEKAGGEDAFVTQLDAAGQLLSSTYWGGSGNDRALAATVDIDGNVHVAGSTTSPDFPLERPLQAQLRGARDGWTARFFGGEVLNGQLFHSTYLGGSAVDEATAISVDLDRRPWIAGFTTSTDFPQLPAAGPHAGGEDAFLVQLEFNGSFLRFSRLLGGTANDRALGVSVLQFTRALDSQAHIAVAGFTTSNDFPTSEPTFQAARAGGEDAFLTFLVRDRDGVVLPVSSTYLGGSGNDRAQSLSLPTFGLTYLGGSTTSANFPTARALQSARAGGSDGFLTAFSGLAAGSVQAPRLAFSTYFGGAGGDQVRGIAVEGAPPDSGRGSVGLTGGGFNLYATGVTASANFPRAAPFDGSLGGASDAFAVKLGPALPRPPLALAAVPLNRNAIAVSWNDTNGDEDGYELFHASIGQDDLIETAELVALLPPNTTRFVESGLQPNSARGYVVRALNPEGTSGLSNFAFARSLPNRPEALQLTGARAVSSRQVLLEWDRNSAAGEDRVVIFRGEGTGQAIPHALSPVVTERFLDGQSVTPDTEYTYRIAVENSGGRSTLSAPRTVVTLAAPSGVRVLPADTRKVRVEWLDNSGREAGYRVERRVGTNFVPVKTVAANTTVIIDDTLPFTGSQFVYRVVAFSGQNVSSPSEAVTAFLAPPPAPTDLKGVTLIAGGTARVTLTWRDNSQFESAFQVQRRPPGGTFVPLGNAGANSPSFTDVDVSVGSTQDYRVRALNGVFSSGFSNTLTVNIPPPQTPNAPGEVRVRAVSPTGLLIRWEDRSLFEETFRVERRGPAGAFREVGSVAKDVTAFVDTGLKPGTRYTYRVRGVNSLGPGAYSEPASGSTQTAGGGQLQVAEELLFGRVPVGKEAVRTVAVRNAGARMDLRVAVADPASPYALVGEERFLLIPPGQTRRLTLRFRPTRSGLALGRLFLASSDPRQPTEGVRLIGEGAP